MSSLQSEIVQRGAEIFDLVDRHPEPLFSKAGFYQRMMEFSMRDEHFKVQMFRFVDVLASLHHGGEIVRHLDEYFADMRNGFAPLVRTGVQAAKIVPWISGQLLRWNVSGMARQFIAGKNPHDVMKTLRKRRGQNREAQQECGGAAKTRALVNGIFFGAPQPFQRSRGRRQPSCRD